MFRSLWRGEFVAMNIDILVCTIRFWNLEPKKTTLIPQTFQYTSVYESLAVAFVNDVVAHCSPQRFT